MVKQSVGVVVATVAAMLAMSGAAQGATFFVTNSNDAGAGSLRAAIAAAAASPETDDVINWATTNVVELQDPLPVLPSVRIVGLNSEVRRAAAAPAFRIFDVPASSTVTITALIISGGRSEGGGNISNAGTLTLQRTIVRDGLAQGAGWIFGGGVYSNGDLILDRSRVTGNRAVASSGFAAGGGIFQADDGSLVIRDSTLWENTAHSTAAGPGGSARGGAIATAAGTLVSQSTVTDNHAVADWPGSTAAGGGLYAGSRALGDAFTVNVRNSTFADNDGIANVYQDAFGTATINLYSSILRTDAEANCAGVQVLSLGFNVYQPACVHNPAPTDVVGDPNLGPLTETPGFAPTRSPLWPSAAIDRGLSDASTDQRGGPRTIDHGNATAPPGGDGTDAGAVEVADTVAPETTVGGPPAHTSDRTPTITFTADEQATIACKLDGQAVACTGGSFTPATPLPDGPHTFAATATDRYGNVDPTPATAAFTVDTVAPQTTVAASPPAVTSADPVTLTVEADEPATVTCTLDGASLAGDCRHVSLPGLAEGPHSFTATATDLAGNTDASPAERGFVVDRTAPETTITSGPPARTQAATATLAFAASEPGSFMCARDGGAPAPCQSPATFAGLAPGAHSVAVAARDAAGNVDPTPATYGWTVAGTPPGGLPPGATKLTVGKLRVPGRLSRRTLRSSGLKASFRLDHPGARWTLDLRRGTRRLARRSGRVTSSSGGLRVIRLKASRKAVRRLPRRGALTVRLVVKAPGQETVRRLARVRLR